MKDRTDSHLRFAHALARAHAPDRGLHPRHPPHPRHPRAAPPRSAPRRWRLAATLVADWDGGTRLGDALQAFLAVPRFAGFARGALVVVLSDGLERGDPAAMIDAVERLSRLAWGLLWLIAARGRAAAMPPRPPRSPAVLPFLDRLGDGSSAARLCAEVLGFERTAA